MSAPPPINATQFSAASGSTNGTTQVAVLNQFTSSAAILLVHVSGSGAIEYSFTPNVGPGQQTPYLTVNFGDDRDYWLCSAWVAGDANSPYWATSNNRLLLWKECGIESADGNKQLVFELSDSTFFLNLQSSCTASVSHYDTNWGNDAVNLQVVNNLTDGASVFLFYIDNKLGANMAYCQNGMNTGDSSPLLPTAFGTTFGSEELWIIQAVDVANQTAYVTGGTSPEVLQLHDADANGTVTLTISSSEVSFASPYGSNSLSLSSQSVSSIQTS